MQAVVATSAIKIAAALVSRRAMTTSTASSAAAAAAIVAATGGSQAATGGSQTLDFDQCPEDDPFPLFDAWFQEQRQHRARSQDDAFAMCLSTYEPSTQRVSSRMVLLKAYQQGTFDFFTHYPSRKGQQLQAHPRAALNFYWQQRQVRVEGVVQRMSAQESDRYFQTRARASQLGAWASRQSQPAKSAKEMEERCHEVARQFQEQPAIPRPEHWGGFCLVPDRIEFWQEGAHRYHTRVLYQRELDTSSWQKSLLFP